MIRRTISIPDSIDQMVQEHADRAGSYSAAVVRLLEAGSKLSNPRRRPSYMATGDGPRDLGVAAERYLKLATRK